jgi:small subunit ribosomal protein S17
MEKTIAVRLTRFVKHPQFFKFLRRETIFKAHDERREAKEGDTVRIEETRPLSKTKRWRLVEVIRRARHVDASLSGLDAGVAQGGDS